MRAALFALIVLACEAQVKPCTPVQREALMSLYKAAVDKTISSGACDKYTRVEECPAYKLVEEHFATAETAMCQGGAVK